MTKHKTLKSLIRARMERTGETYSTARRHIVATAPDRTVPGLLDGYPLGGGGEHRASSQLDGLLRHRGGTAPHTGEPYSAAMLCGLGGGIGFLYAVFEYKQAATTTMTVVAQHHPEPFVPAALARLGIDARITTTRSAAVADRRLTAALADGLPVLCAVVDPPWRPSAHGDPIDVVLAGRDGDDALVDDAGDLHRLPWADLVAAGAGRAEHRALTLGAAGPLDLPSAIADAVATTAAHLTGPVLGHAYDVNFGLSGMARLLADLGDRTGRTGWLRRFAAPGALAGAARRLHDCLEHEHTAPGATRPLYADFLDEAAPIMGAPGYAEAAALYREAGARWSELAATAEAVAESAQPGEAGLDALLTRAERAVALERTAVTRLGQ